jgi:hypothetical protein
MIDLNDTDKVITLTKTLLKTNMQFLGAIIGLQLILILALAALATNHWGTFWAGVDVTMALIILLAVLRNFAALGKLQKSADDIDRSIARWRAAIRKPPRFPTDASRP